MERTKIETLVTKILGHEPEETYKPPKTILTPEFFGWNMKMLSEEPDNDFRWSACMAMITTLLEDLGYSEGVEIFQSMYKGGE